jgi:hypothetical protein
MKRSAPLVLAATALAGGCATYYPAYPRPVAVLPAPAVVYPAPVVVAPPPSAYFSFSYGSGPGYGGWRPGRPWGWRY